MAESLDFQINDLKFRAAISDKFPYARATAPFRKEQFDAAPTVGDQSLSGWWTRGQLSFHMGAGVKYYEVLDGDEVLNRFDTGANVEWYEPGEVTLPTAVEAGLTAPVDSYATWWPPALFGRGGTYLGFVSVLSAGNKFRFCRAPLTLTQTPVDQTVASGEPLFAFPGVDETHIFVVTLANTIERFTLSGSTLIADGVQYTHTARIVGGWVAKERLWIMDENGDIFTRGDSPTGAAPEALGTPDSGVGQLAGAAEYRYQYVAFADAPNGVYVTNGSERIFHIGVDQTTSTPTLTWGRVVAELPGGDIAIGLRYHLDRLVIVGLEGTVRVANIATDGGIRYGGTSLTIGKQAWCRQLAAYDTRVYLAGPPLDRSAANWYETGTVYAVDLASAVDESALTYAAGPVLDFPTYDSTMPTGVAHVREDKPCPWDWELGMYRTTYTYVPSGALRTGYHRLGTLDSKLFKEVMVRADGDGSIEVFQVDSEGVETSLGTMAVVSTTAESKVKTFQFATSGPVERLALKFVLSTGTGGPKLLGYQIKALPSPRRQRLIQWPVVAADAYRDRYGKEHGKRDGAWEAWTVLEQLEESNALVTFTDHRTGETGEAFIENIELQSDTPSQGATSGFGGIGMITLRKVS